MAKHVSLRIHSLSAVTLWLLAAIHVSSMANHFKKWNKDIKSRNMPVQDTQTNLESDTDYRNWVLRDPMPLESVYKQKQLRLKRSIHREKIAKYVVTSTSPYSSMVYIGVGCVGTLISPIHVLTAAHCVHDGRKKRTGQLMSPLKIGLLRPNGKQHKIRVKKIFVPNEIQPTTASRFTYDYAVLKLVRPHRRPYLKYKATRKNVRALTFHVFERERNRKSLNMFKYSYCPVRNTHKKYRTNFYKIDAKDCPSTRGDSGTAVFDSSNDKEKAVIGLLSAHATYRLRSGGYYYATVILKLTDFDVSKINQWVRDS